MGVNLTHMMTDGWRPSSHAAVDISVQRVFLGIQLPAQETS
jgi:hypothetical protein